MTTELDERLRRYLDGADAEARNGDTNAVIRGLVAKLTDALAEHRTDDAEKFAMVHGLLEQHHFRIGAVESFAAKVEAKADRLAEDTGRHQIVVAEGRADGRMKVLLALMGAALAVIGTLFVWAITRAR